MRSAVRWWWRKHMTWSILCYLYLALTLPWKLSEPLLCSWRRYISISINAQYIPCLKRQRQIQRKQQYTHTRACTHARARTRANARTHARERTHARTHTYTHTQRQRYCLFTVIPYWLIWYYLVFDAFGIICCHKRAFSLPHCLELGVYGHNGPA